MRIPITLLREIRYYLLLSHQILEPTKALDWALYLRLFPWIGGRREIEDALFNLVNQDSLELRQIKAALRGDL